MRRILIECGWGAKRSQVAANTLKHSGHCLIVEDSVFDSEKMSRVVNQSSKSMAVRIASTLQAAREMLAEAAPTFILLDNNLPDGLGANFALELAQDERLATIPIVMVSDWPSPFMWEKAQSAGVLHVVDKAGFDARYVHAAINATRKRHVHLN